MIPSFNSLSRDHILIKRGPREAPLVVTFNSLSRDHYCRKKDYALCSLANFQLPLSGSLNRRTRTATTESKVEDFQLPLSGSHIDTVRFTFYINELSTPSLGITDMEIVYVANYSPDIFQLPLSGSLYR